MNAALFAGGLGTRISGETMVPAEPMVAIGDRSTLWPIFKFDQAHSIQDFLICCAHKCYKNKEFISTYASHVSEATFGVREHTMRVNGNNAEDWRNMLVEYR